MFSGCTEGAEPGAGASANADLSCIIQGRAGEGTRTKIPVGEGSSPGSRALDSQLWSLCWWKQVGRAVTTPSFLTSSPQTVLRIVVLGIWDYIENKIEVKTVSLAPPEPAILEAEVSLAPPSQPSWKLETVTVLSVPGWEPSAKASCLPHWTHESVQLCHWAGGEGRRLRKSSSERIWSKISP